jgi:hypothetical protein
VTTIKKRKMVSLLVLAVGVLGAMVVVQAAVATHPRPLAASPLRVPLVPAYEECTSPNRIHGPPLVFDSCNPPVQTSKFLTVGTFDANGANANSVGFFKFAVNTASTENIVLTGSISDVRCKPGVSACSNANTADGPDYTGDLEIEATVRVTDHDNAVAPGGGTDPATLVDIPFPVGMSCLSTSDPSIGSTCTVMTPGPCPPPGCSSVENGDRTVIGMKQVEVFDGGADGFTGTADNTLFMEQGVFIP